MDTYAVFISRSTMHLISADTREEAERRARAGNGQTDPESVTVYSEWRPTEAQALAMFPPEPDEDKPAERI